MTNMEKIKGFVREKLDNLNWAHTKEVVRLALEIAEKEKADKGIVEIAAWLHDIGKSEPGINIIYHHIKSVEISEKFLKELKVEKSKIEKINQCIIEHMGPENGYFLGNMLKKEGKAWDFFPRPSTNESKALYDADMINLLGPFGIIKRVFLGAKMGINFNDIVKNLLGESQKCLDDLKTETGKRIGNKQYQKTKEFLDMVKI